MPSRLIRVGACQKHALLCAQPHVLVLPAVTVDGVLSYLHFLAIMSAVDMSVCMSVQVSTCNYRAFSLLLRQDLTLQPWLS